MNDWSGRVFCLLTPDCLRRHLARSALDRFREAGLRLEGWRSVTVSAAAIDAVAVIQGLGAGGTFRYRALDALFGLGPALALRLADDRERTEDDLYRTTHRLKGDSAPDAEPGSIRRDLGSVNAVLSLLHVSDSPERSRLESAALLPADEDAPFRPAGDLPALLELLERTQPRETRGFPEVLAAVRGRLAAHLWPRLTPAGRDLLQALAASGGLAAPDVGARLAAEAVGAASHPLVKLLRARFDPGEPPVDVDRASHVLRAHGLALDPWEHAVLATSIYFEPARRAGLLATAADSVPS